MIWMQPPGTATMAHLFLDAYHATGDEYYYQAAEKAAGILIWVSIPPVAGTTWRTSRANRRCATGTRRVGKNAWRLEEFQHYWDNATFDDVDDDGRGAGCCCVSTLKSAIRNTGLPSTKRFSSCSTASIRSAAGRSGTRRRPTSCRTTRRTSRSTTTWPRRTSSFSSSATRPWARRASWIRSCAGCRRSS